jgi:predicted nuclease with TOPRIM domain
MQRMPVLAKLLLLSTTEKAAKQVEFDKQRTLIYGGNDSGKSSIVKSIYWALGAEPAIVNQNWHKAEITAVLWFSLDNVDYAILRHKNQFAVFDQNSTILNKFNRVSTQLSPFLADKFSFKLRLAMRDGRMAVPPPAFLYLPYYIDQDASWDRTWSSFSNISQFANWKKDVAEFHVGIRPGEYYELRGKKLGVETAICDAELEQRIVSGILDRLRKSFGSAEFDIELKMFQHEIDILVQQCNKLLIRENEYRARFAELHNEKSELTEQIRFAGRAAADLDKDYQFATDTLHESEVACPVCGTGYQNSFAERFSIAADEDRITTLISDLQDRVTEIDIELTRLNKEFTETTVEFSEIRNLLQSKRETVTLGELLKKEGKKEADTALNERYEELSGILVARATELKEIKRQLVALTEKTRVKEISEFYLNRMKLDLLSLKVENLPEKTYKRIDSSVKETGSSRPRALLAYYFSILHTIRKFGDGTFCPVVIDSPNQQAQDKVSLKAMLAFIRDHQPADSQLVLALEEDLKVDIPGARIVLENPKYHMLRTEEYKTVAELVVPMLTATLQMT